MSSEVATEPLFAASYAKLGRARTFIAELRSVQEAYAETGIRSRVYVEDGLPKFEFSWDSVGLLPGLILGDTVHNLRVALDLMASELAVLAKQNPDRVYFPFATSLSELRKSTKFKAFAKCGDDCTRLLEEIAPYHGGNEALRALHDLDVRDKHRSLIPSLQDINWIFEGELDLGDPAANTMVGRAELLCFKFPDGTPLPGKELVPSLEMFAEAVERVLEAFAALVAARE